MIANPVAGSTFRRAAALPIDGRKRRKVVCLLAAYADAGEPNPPVRLLAERLNLRVQAVDALLRRLEQDGHLRVERAANQRNRYELVLEGGAR